MNDNGCAALIYRVAGRVEAKCLGGAGSIHCHAGTAVLTAEVNPLPRLLYVAKVRKHVMRAVPQGGLIGFAAMLALAGTALRLVLLALWGIKKENTSIAKQPCKSIQLRSPCGAAAVRSSIRTAGL